MAANSQLREDSSTPAPTDGLHGFLPSRAMCTDNAAMIAAAGWHRLRLDGPTPLDAGAYPNLRLRVEASAPSHRGFDVARGSRRASTTTTPVAWSAGGTAARDFVPAAPVVLAPMAGVTNAPFRALCRRFGPGLVYVNEMVMATALVHGNAKTERMVTFGPDEHPRSLQIYGSRPGDDGPGRRPRLCDAGLVDHVDLNFGCPAAKVTRKGGGAAVPAKPGLLRAIVRAAVDGGRAVRRAGHGEVPHRARTTRCSPTCAPGAICADEGVVAIALHARTAEQHYAGDARWDAIGELKAHVHDDPGARQRRHLGGRRRRGDDARRPAATASSSAAAASAGRGCSATCRRARRPAGAAVAAARRGARA